MLLDHLWLKPAETSGSVQLFGHARLMDDPLQQTVFLKAGRGSVCRSARQRASDFRPQGRRSALPRADVQTFDGLDCVTITEGSQHGDDVRLRGKGIPVLNWHGRGDLFVHIEVRVPRS